MSRPPKYLDSTKVSVNGETARSKLQAGSERRAIIDRVIDSGGTASIKNLEDHFGFDLKGKIAALVRIGWLVVTK